MADDRFGIVGKIIARTYEVRDVVAEGGFGVVYRAYHQGFRAEVALKCLKIPNELSDEQRRAFLEQFRAEAEVLFRLSSHSPYIVRPLHVDAFHTADRRLVPFMALEWLEGRTLDGLIVQRVENGRPPLSLTKLVRLLTPVAGALEQAHHLPGKDGPQTVIHRDMKPENLFIARVGGEDVAKILDFGISKVKSTAGQMAGRASKNADALVSFSPAYGAPEQWAPRRFGQTGRWTDVWGLALTVVEAAKGDLVINGDHQEMMGTILDPERRPTPRNEGVQVTDEVEKIFQRALAVDPRQRYQSVGAFWDDLTLALGLQQEVGGRVSIEHQRAQKKAGRSTTGDAPAGFDTIRPAARSVSLPAIDLGHARDVPKPAAPAGPAQAPQRSAPAATELQIMKPGEQLEGIGVLASYSSASRPGPVSPVRARVPVSSYAPGGHRPSLVKALGPALALIALSVAVTLLDRAFAHSRGIPLSFGPVRASWIAGGFMVAALISGVNALRSTWEE